MQKTKIEWTDYTWNPIKGLCPVGCWYCYARKIYKRFHKEEKLYYLIDDTWRQLEKLRKPSKIFVCSTIELFHPKIKPHWRDQVFREIEKAPQHTFQILTKMPENIDRPMPDNVWLGVSITGEDDRQDCKALCALDDSKARIKFVSHEPFLAPLYWNISPEVIDWLIVGRLTGHGKKHDPKKRWIRKHVIQARNHKIPLFLKNNLKDIWGEDKLIQEFPK